MAWVMSSRRVLGGLEFFIGNVRVAQVEWHGMHTYVIIAGHPMFEANDTAEAMRAMHAALNAPPPEDAEVSTFSKQRKQSCTTHSSSPSSPPSSSEGEPS